MKQIKLFLFLLFIFSITSCIREYATLTDFYIINNSSYNIQIKAYNVDVRSIGVPTDTIIDIPINKYFLFYETKKGKNSPATFPFGISSDSIEVFVNNSLIITHLNPVRFSKNTEYNIFDIHNYTGGLKDEDYYEYKYFITDNMLILSSK